MNFNFLESLKLKKDPFYRPIKNLLQFNPNSLMYYRRAFTHRSSNKKDLNGHAINYERLEFLGDSILSSIISSYLFKNIPTGSEGYLTQMRSKIVSRSHLNELGLELNLLQFIESNISEDNYGDNIHGNLFEALIGAIFLDRGYPYCKKFVFEKVINPHVNLERLKNKIISYKSLFIEWCQKNKKLYHYETFEDSGNDPVKHFSVKLSINHKVISKARDTSKKKAEEKASKRAFFIFQDDILKHKNQNS
tara:strand:+ start:253 stop:999 length:747 start_codon:yes stop_codon:yes gene_type:complete